MSDASKPNLPSAFPTLSARELYALWTDANRGNMKRKADLWENLDEEDLAIWSIFARSLRNHMRGTPL